MNNPLRGRLPILHALPIKETIHRRVWKVQLADDFLSQSKFSLLKQYLSGQASAYQTEKRVLSALSEQATRSCPTPVLEWYSDENCLLLMNWCGDQTLDAFAQSQQLMDVANPVVAEILTAYSLLESAFSSINLLPTTTNTMFDFEQTCQTGFKIFKLLLTKSVVPSVLEAKWQQFTSVLQQAPMTFGPLDYQANNIVLDNRLKPYFIDFESIGWDWPARRLVQYLTSIGVGNPNGEFIPLLNRKVLAQSVDKEMQHRLDGHSLLFYLIILDRVVRATARPDSSFAQILTKQWGDLTNRYQQAICQLQTVVLSDWVITQDLRRWLA